MKHHVWRMILISAWLLLCSLAHAGKFTYVYTDPQGTPIAEADEQGNITKIFDYRPYGDQALGQPPDGPGYTGHVNDPDTGLVYMQARYYDPELGRFLSVDPLGPKPAELFGFNRYAYADNNPIAHTDPDGRCPVCIVAVPLFIGLMTHSDCANAPGPGDERVSLTTADHLSAVVGSLPPGRAATLVRVGVGAEKIGQKAADTSRAARREAMRDAGIPTSQQPLSQSQNASGREYSYDVPATGGSTQRMSVQQQTMDRSHQDQPHWEAGKVKTEKKGSEAVPQINRYGRPKLDSDKSKVDY
ncbi:RHS repeat-associated core domain-containing protein [Dyella sp. 2HG41-7]|uniref:RHS repeat domain-containing protein n=1 Tax=Dyella sp. 2HG41-7 TaxID=2883239 RepID=UPI001F3A4EF6|nr:RHS repeat-associated core domain-containing protein [Dyella sp. 2HG41-7]